MWVDSEIRNFNGSDLHPTDELDVEIISLGESIGVTSLRFEIVGAFLDLIDRGNIAAALNSPSQSDKSFSIDSSTEADFNKKILRLISENSSVRINWADKGFQPVMDAELGFTLIEGLMKLLKRNLFDPEFIAGYSHYAAKLIIYWAQDEPFRDSTRDTYVYED